MINREEFESMEDVGRSSERREKVVRYLKENSDGCYKMKEIEENCGVKFSFEVLKKLVNDGIIVKKNGYFGISDYNGSEVVEKVEKVEKKSKRK